MASHRSQGVLILFPFTQIDITFPPRREGKLLLLPILSAAHPLARSLGSNKFLDANLTRNCPAITRINIEPCDFSLHLCALIYCLFEIADLMRIITPMQYTHCAIPPLRPSRACTFNQIFPFFSPTFTQVQFRAIKFVFPYKSDIEEIYHHKLYEIFYFTKIYEIYRKILAEKKVIGGQSVRSMHYLNYQE